MDSSDKHGSSQSPRAVQVCFQLSQLRKCVQCCDKMSCNPLGSQARLEARAAAAEERDAQQQQLQQSLAQKHAAAEQRAEESLQAKANRAARHAEFVRHRSAAASSQRQQNALLKERDLAMRMDSAREARETVLYERVCLHSLAAAIVWRFTL